MTPVYHIQHPRHCRWAVQQRHQESHLSNDQGRQDPSASTLDDIARHFVEARRAGRSLPDFPGAIPADLVTAY